MIDRYIETDGAQSWAAEIAFMIGMSIVAVLCSASPEIAW